MDMSGQDRSSPLLPPIHITVSEAAILFEEAGIPRTKRSIRRYCSRGDIEHVKSENEFHLPQFFLDRDAVLTFIEQEKNLRAEQQRDMSGLIRTDPVKTGQDRLDIPPDSTGDSSGRGDGPGMIDFLKKQIEQKDKQIETKDKQINDLLERSRETNILIQGLQSVLGLPQPRRNDEGDNPVTERD